MAGTTQIMGATVFLFATISATKKMIGCAQSYDRGVSNDAKDVSCQSSGTSKEYVAGTMADYDLSFKGVNKVYTTQEQNTNVASKTFWDACGSGTVIEMIVGPAVTTGSIVEKCNFIVTSCKLSSKVGDPETYDVSGKVSGGWTTVTL